MNNISLIDWFKIKFSELKVKFDFIKWVKNPINLTRVGNFLDDLEKLGNNPPVEKFVDALMSNFEELQEIPDFKEKALQFPTMEVGDFLTIVPKEYRPYAKLILSKLDKFFMRSKND